ncbi:YciN family protein [Rahnella sp. PCH160]|uniref:YciN family protein n=1 Tax=Rahnella sp. PCH160 TaxID=3447928 RepID=UPI0039FBC4A9
MHENTSAVSREALLAEANKVIREHDEYLSGMIATGVEQKGNVLVFRGEFFMDENGLPTRKTTAVFNMFKHLAHLFSEKYHLED